MTNQQLTLFGRDERASQLKRIALRLALRVVDQVGAKVVAPELDMSPPNLRLALRELERHGLSFDQWWLLLTFDDESTIVGGLAEATGHEPLVRRPALTDSEMLGRLLKSLAKAGPAGHAILEDAQIGLPLGGEP